MSNESDAKANQREAKKRISAAEVYLYKAVELMEKAQMKVSVIQVGLNQNYTKIGGIKDKLKGQIYDLQRCRESGVCKVDEMILRQLER